jgi:hypothetical protein
MNELLARYSDLPLAEQFQTGATVIVVGFFLVLAALFCGPSLLAGARSLFPDETPEDLEDDEQRLVAAKRRARLELAARVPHQVDAADERRLLEAICHMPHPTNRIH